MVGSFLISLVQFRDIDIHTPRIEIIVIHPDCLECIIALEDLVDMLTEQRQKLRFLGGEFLRLIIDIERLLLSIEGIFADAEHCHVLVSLPPSRGVRMALIRDTSSSIEKGL